MTHLQNIVEVLGKKRRPFLIVTIYDAKLWNSLHHCYCATIDLKKTNIQQFLELLISSIWNVLLARKKNGENLVDMFSFLFLNWKVLSSKT